MNHWASQFIGLAWRYNASGPDAFNCWSFFKHIQLIQYVIHVADIEAPSTWSDAMRLFETSHERQYWIEIEHPIEGCAVMMARNRVPVHIGTWISANNTNGVLHCAQPIGVVFQTTRSLQASGWGRLTYYKHV